MGQERIFHKRIRLEPIVAKQLCACKSILTEAAHTNEELQGIITNRAIPRALADDPVLSHLGGLANSGGFTRSRVNGSTVNIAVSLSNWSRVRDLSEGVRRINEGGIIEACIKWAVSSPSTLRGLYAEYLESIR
jgi:hypothetical protein